MKVVGMIQSTATQEVEAKGEEYVAARADADAPCRRLVGGELLFVRSFPMSSKSSIHTIYSIHVME